MNEINELLATVMVFCLIIGAAIILCFFAGCQSAQPVHWDNCDSELFTDSDTDTDTGPFIESNESLWKVWDVEDESWWGIADDNMGEYFRSYRSAKNALEQAYENGHLGVPNRVRYFEYGLDLVGEND